MPEKPPGPPRSTPQLYMTPQLAKRKDGLCPSLFQDKKEKPGYHHKVYRTNSHLLLQINENSEVIEVQTIYESVKAELKRFTKPGQGLTHLAFKPEGFIWKMEFSDEGPAEKAHKTYKMQVICSAISSDPTEYIIDTVLVPKRSVDPDPLAPPLTGFKEAKAIFDSVALRIRKAIVRLEFPEFPEGCKGRPFREVYQLNARVRDVVFCLIG